MNDPAAGDWHLDKRIPIAIILTLLTQLVGFLVGGSIYAAKLDARIAYIEGFINDNKKNQERLAVIETHLDALQKAMQRIEIKLEKGE